MLHCRVCRPARWTDREWITRMIYLVLWIAHVLFGHAQQNDDLLSQLNISHNIIQDYNMTAKIFAITTLLYGTTRNEPRTMPCSKLFALKGAKRKLEQWVTGATNNDKHKQNEATPSCWEKTVHAEDSEHNTLLSHHQSSYLRRHAVLLASETAPYSEETPWTVIRAKKYTQCNETFTPERCCMKTHPLIILGDG
jgi:hypothetical protein